MMSPIQDTLSNPVIRINNVIVTIKPNSFSFTVGKGEKKVSGVSVGGGASGVSVSEDVTTRVGKMKMSFFTTAENIARFRDWKSQPTSSGNSISATQGNTHITGTYLQLVNEPDIMIESEGSFEVEFQGPPLSTGT